MGDLQISVLSLKADGFSQASIQGEDRDNSHLADQAHVVPLCYDQLAFVIFFIIDKLVRGSPLFIKKNKNFKISLFKSGPFFGQIFYS